MAAREEMRLGSMEGWCGGFVAHVGTVLLRPEARILYSVSQTLTRTLAPNTS